MTEQNSYLTDRFFLLLGLVVLFGTCSLIFPIFFWVHLFAYPILGMLAWGDFKTLVDGNLLSASAELGSTPELGQRSRVRFSISSSSPGARPSGEWELFLPLLRTLEFEEPVSKLINSSSSEKIEQSLVANPIARKLGFEKIDKIRMTAESRLSIWKREIELKLDAPPFRVVPIQKKLNDQAFEDLGKSQNLFRLGNRRLMRGRVSDQFHSVREYQFPDSMRHIDAKKTAKFGKLMTRTYDSYLQHHLILALDLGRGMCGKLGESEKSDFYLSATLALAQNAFSSRDRVSLVGFSHKTHAILRQAQSMHSFLPLFQGLPQFRPSETASNFELMSALIDQVSSQRSIVVILSDVSSPSVQESILAALPRLCRKHLVVVAGLLNEEHSLDKAITDSTSKLTVESYNHVLYDYWLKERLENFKFKINSLGGAAIVVSEGDWLSVVVKIYELMRQSVRI